jgi:acyl dehydratase
MPPGTELGVSDWLQVTQAQIDEFGRLTFDPSPHHNDPEWAAENSRTGSTISYGFFTLSLLTVFSQQVFARLEIGGDESIQLLNFGFNRVRLPESVPAGAEIRGRFTVSGARWRDAGGLEVTLDSVVEINGNDRPALVAEWLFVAVRNEQQAVT